MADMSKHSCCPMLIINDPDENLLTRVDHGFPLRPTNCNEAEHHDVYTMTAYLVSYINNNYYTHI